MRSFKRIPNDPRPPIRLPCGSKRRKIERDRRQIEITPRDLSANGAANEPCNVMRPFCFTAAAVLCVCVCVGAALRQFLAVVVVVDDDVVVGGGVG